jgi:hypothetical protein
MSTYTEYTETLTSNSLCPNMPTQSPSMSPSVSPTSSPTESPSTSPSQSPSTSPSASPSNSPSSSPTKSPTGSPSSSPTLSPTLSGWTDRGNLIIGEYAGDESGFSVSLSGDGNTVAIGAPYNGGNGERSGHIRVYDWDGTNWTQRGADIDGEYDHDKFGQSVSLSGNGDTVAIGSANNRECQGHVRVFDWNQRYYDIEADVSGLGYSVSLSNGGNSVAIGAAFSGDVLVFDDPHPITASPTQSPSMSPTSPTKSPSISPTVLTWTQLGADIDGEASNDFSGQLVPISADGNTVAIGAMFNDGNGSDSGHVRVYGWDGTNWTQRGQDIDGEAGGDYSGTSVSLSDDGNTVAIGASHNDGNGSDSGHVRVYDWDGTNWAQRGADIDGAASDDRAGNLSLSGDGNSVAIGAYYAANSAGHVRVFDWDGTNWTQRGAAIDGEASNDYSGEFVSLSNNANTVAIGAESNDGNGEDSGHVHVYDWNGTSWTQRGADIDGEAVDDRAGSVSLSDDGNTVAIGAYYADGLDYDLGNVRVFDWDGTAWTQRGYDIFGEGTCDNSGSSISLSGDRNTVAIGSKVGNYVTVYDWDGTAWTLRGARIDAESSGDRFGYAVSISSNGNVVAIGANFNDGNGSNSGHVRMFKWPISD